MGVNDEVTRLIAEGQSKFQQAARVLREEVTRLQLEADAERYEHGDTQWLMALNEEFDVVTRRAQAVEAVVLLSDMEFYVRKDR